MQKQLLRKKQIAFLTKNTGYSRKGRRKLDWLAFHLPKKQVEALTKVALERGLIEEKDLKKVD